VLGVALSKKFSEAASNAPMEGVKVSETVQFPPGSIEGSDGFIVEQAVADAVLVMAKSAAFVPLRLGLKVKTRFWVPVFVNNTVIVALVVPTVTVPNDSLAGRLTTGMPGEIPVPVRATLCVLGVALSAKFSDADSADVVEGLNVSVTVQLPPATTGVPTAQLAAVILKSALLMPETAGALVKFSEAVPVFIRVIIAGALVTPCVTDPNPRLAGKLTAGAVPVPLRATLWEAGVALSAKFNVALSAAAVEGENVSVTVQLPPAATGDAVEQVAEAIAKSDAFVPVTLGLLVNVRAAVPVFIRVTITCGLVEPRGTEPKAVLAGRLTIGAGAVVPVPISETLCGLGVALSAKVSEALSADVVEGLNVSVTVQLAPAFTGAAVEHVADTILKSAAFVPEMAGLLLKISDPVPVFIRVTVTCPLVPPCGTVPNDVLAGRLTAGAVPVPVNGTLCVLGVALSAKFSEALSAPTVDGLNVRFTVQDPPGATGFAGTQVLEAIAKSPAFAPVMDGELLKTSDPLPVFIRVSAICALVVPISILPNGRLAGRLTAGTVPVPVRGTLCVLGVALSAKASVALSASPVNGLKVIETEHVPPGVTGSADKQVLETIAKSAAFGPLMVGFKVNVRADDPMFVSVTVEG
jgi:hypothetical protein